MTRCAVSNLDRAALVRPVGLAPTETLVVPRGRKLASKEMAEALQTTASPARGPGFAPRSRTVRVYIAEEQQILRSAYEAFFASLPDLEVIGSSDNTSGEFLAEVGSTLRPHVMLVGFRVLQATAVERLELVRERCPDVAIVLLSAYYDVKGIKALREFSRGASVGCAYLLKHTIDTVEQLTHVVRSAAEGRVILDPAVMDGLIATGESYSGFLKDLTAKELEVIGWMAKGYRNTTIAEVLGMDIKTVERHINSIYSKLGTVPDSKHARVHAVMAYLRAVGLLPAQDFAESH